jgi:probable phosphoglycerate mutase
MSSDAFAPPPLPRTRFCCIRHGETAWNAERRLQGQLDIDLNAHGVAQARAAGRWLARRGGIDLLYASDLARAWHTAQAIGAALDLLPSPLPALRERRYGIFEGLTYDEAHAAHPEAYARHLAREADFVIPGGESLSQFVARVIDALETLRAAHAGQTLALVLHGGVLDILNRFVRGRPLEAPRDFLIPNAGLNWIVHDAGGWHLEAWAQTAHLEDATLDEVLK